MEVMYTLCAYCERSAGEVCGQDGVACLAEALRFTVVNDKRILLCGRCRARWARTAPAGGCAALLAPIDFPPGVSSVEHFCQKLADAGGPEEGAEFELLMRREGAYFVGQCPHCGVRVRSLADVNAFGDRGR